MPAFGRIYSPDARDENFLMRTVLEAEPPPVLPPYKYYLRGLPLDQGNEGICVGASLEGWLRCSPRMTSTGALFSQDKPAMKIIYCEACDRDEWAENDWCDPQFGTSVRAGVQALRERGHIGQFVWARDAVTISQWLRSGKGPAVFGTVWKEGMMQVDSKGFLHATGANLGGHAYFANGDNSVQRKMRFQQSWGPGPWGRNNGVFWMGYDDIDLLLAEDGECVGLLEVPVL